MRLKYDFAATSAESDIGWQADASDFPDASEMVQFRRDTQGREWIALYEHASWSDESRSADPEEFKKHRNVWIQVRSYIVPKNQSAACWRWLKKQQFIGRDMPHGYHMYEGYIGEYPWATAFGPYRDEQQSDIHEGGVPYSLKPTWNSLSVHSDAFQMSGIGIEVPEERLFETVPLRWNGVSGYDQLNGRHGFLDPSVEEPGPTALLANMEVLQETLQREELVLFWTALGEKVVVGSDAQIPHLAYSRSFMLSAKGILAGPALTEVR